MLTYDSLIQQAQLRGMPSTKIRGMLREYLQVLILKELYRAKFGKKLYFTGGTYLRLVHHIKRFSEDLDFNTDTITKGEFKDLLSKIRKELIRTGIDSGLSFAYRGNMFVSSFIFPTIERAFNVVSKYSKKEGIIIKVETNRPKWKIRKEPQVIAGFGEVYPCICTDKSALFADKIDALNKKNRGRHIYDIIFMLSNKCPVDKRVLLALGIKETPEDIILNRIKTFSKFELKKQAEILRPFLFDEQEAELVVNAHRIIPALLKNISIR
jgi:predicted nucleotidyltransferase component of viral defense system